MNKREFLRSLEDKLSILDENEVNDILNEYEDIIDEKVKNGKTIEEAVSEFGSIGELSTEILKAYKINSKYAKEKEPKNRVKSFEEGIKNTSKTCADFVSGLFKNHNFSIEFIFEIVIKFLILLVLLALLRLPFELISRIGEAIFDMAFSPLDDVLGALFDIGIVILYLIVGAFIFIAMFKQYLNVDTKILRKKEQKVVKAKKEKKSENKNESIKDEAVKARETKKSNGTVAKIFLNLYKLFMFFVFLIPLWLCVFGLSVGLCMVVYYSIIGIKILGLAITILGLLIGFGWLTSFFHSITFDTKRIPAFSIILAIFITIIGGIIFVNELMSFEYKDEYYQVYDEYSVYEEEIVLQNPKHELYSYGTNIEYEIDDTRTDNNILIRVYYPEEVIDIDGIYVFDDYYIAPDYHHINEFKLFKDSYNSLISNLKDGVIYNYSDLAVYKYVVIGNSNTINKIK